ncbi:sperm-associated antigen 1 [Drosophila grimshawi]|uniref:GH21571 n=1 Tax=Drosophila grimshawi TaxID=7222 RepID=B4JRW2_DROGR|nr:sperm-associated antigen 1 [Drosophila grimshawi]XP_043071117.1 sperm-associated antigen 1 [Drosophila grimshawi]EDV94502.1 GH21571 [Drosophila grimshawi]
MEKKRLLEKYQIPVGHLDFDYVKKCENPREMEKIVMILRSGEEGFYPDLTRCAEEKLKELKPNSKMFRYEEQIRTSDTLDVQELKPIYDWTEHIKYKDHALSVLKEDSTHLPPIRKPSKIEIDKQEDKDTKTQKAESAAKTNISAKKQTNRIKSTDYNKWDKYDPDEEILRMDLEEERTKEQVQVRANQLETAAVAKSKAGHIDKQAVAEQRLAEQLKKLSQLEREQYAERFRLRGNEYFKVKDYDQAVSEYTLAIEYDPEQAARAYNNRAISQLKQHKYVAAMEDCEACLRLEPDNVKAILRLADANYGYGRRRESYGLYERVLNLESNNASAQKMLKQLRQELGELAPSNATRLIIEEVEQKDQKEQKSQKEKKDQKEQLKPKAKPQPKVVQTKKEYDLAELVKPNRVVKSKIASAAEALGKLKGSNHNPNSNSDIGQKQQQMPLPLMMMQQGMPTSQPELRLNNNSGSSKNKLLIQEL